MRKYIVAAVVVVGVGVVASVFVLPDSSDIVRQQATDVTAVDMGKVDVEAEYAQGRRTFPIIVGLADKKIAAGDRPAAIALWEEFVNANPNNAQGRKKLAEQYQLAGRQDDYNKQLEAIAAAEPTEANLRVLSDIYNANKDYPKQVDILKKIVEVTQGKNPQSYVDLATMQVVINDKEGALKTVEELKAKHPTFNSYAVTRIHVVILAEKGEADKAFETAKAWIDSPVIVPAPVVNAPVGADGKPATPPADPRPKELADLCNILHYSGHADKAVALVDPHLDMLEREPELVVAYVNADVTAGRADHAYALLQKIDEAQKMTPALYPIYLELAIKREDMAAAETIANKMDVNQFNEEQALNVIEVARANNAPTVFKTLLSRFGTEPVLENKPVLAAVIAIHQNDKTQDKKIEVALNTQLSGLQRIRLAETCARAEKTACFEAIVKQFPAIDQMSPDQVAQYAQLFIIADRPKEVIEPIGARAAQPNAHKDIVHAHHKLAAADGRMDILKPWLEANANTAPMLELQQLYYIAADHRKGAVASDIAERLYARDPSPANRIIYTNALIAAGDNEKAIVLLREQMKEPAANDGLYLATLSKLARKNNAYKKELADYAEAALRSDRGDHRQQLNYAYILINNGRKDVATPYAKKYAAERGGEWKKMYAQLTQKPGKGGAAPVVLSREQRVEMAQSKTISEANKRQIAFSLLKDGHKADATKIFQDLAANKGPDSQEVKDLMYMWGGKLNAQQLEWVKNRAANASAYDKNRWAELINTTADDQAAMQYVSSTPDALYNRPLRQRFFRNLALSGSRQNYDVAMRDWVAQTTDVPALTDYASIGYAYGYREAAINGYNRVLALDPNNSKALSHVSALQFVKGKYSEADKNLTRYLSQTPAPDAQGATDSAQAHFYKGELLRRDGKKEAAQAEYAQVVQMTQASGTTAPDALSRLYTSQFRLGQHDQAKAGFNTLLANHPDDRGLLADYMSALIEYNYLNEATRVANQYDKTSPYYKGSSLQGRSSHVSSVERLSNGREMKITFSQPIEGKSPLKQVGEKVAWLESSTAGYDTLSISAKPGYVVRYVPTANEQFQIAAAPMDEITPQEETYRQQDLRLQLLYARIEQESGQHERANERIKVLKQYYPNDSQLMAYQAGIASAEGDNSKAIGLLQQAQSMSPENEEIALQIHNLKNAGSAGRGINNYIKLDHAYRAIGDNNEQITTLSGAASAANRTELGFNLQNDWLNTENTRRGSDGVFGDYEMTRQRGEIYLAHTLESGQRLQGSVFGNNKTAGFGGYLDLYNTPVGNLQLLAEYHRPYWDFVEAVAEHANRDRVGFKNYANLTRKTSLGLEASINKYNVDVLDDARKTALFRASIAHELQPKTESQPYLGVGYGFDGEYKIGDAKTVLDLTLTPFEPFPLVDREVHSITGIYRNDFNNNRTHVQLVGGVAYDRFSSSFFPLVDGRVDHDLNDRWQIGARTRYSMQTNNTDNKQLDVGADLIYKF